MSHAYPILLDVTRRRIVIVGGGPVAARKAAGLIEAGASDLTIISPHFAADFPPAVVKREMAYEPDVLNGATLVFAATNRPEVNEAIVRDCRARGILVNRADSDSAAPGDFVTPAKFQDQSILVTVSAASAALAASIRDALQRRWDPRWTKMAAAMQILRPWIKSYPALSADQRATIFRQLATEEALNVLDQNGQDALRAWIKTKHPILDSFTG